MKEVLILLKGIFSLPILAIVNILQDKEYIERIDGEVVTSEEKNIDDWDRYFKNEFIPLEIRKDFVING